jgi:hypothetical protein
MNRDEPREPSPTEGEIVGDEHVEVLVEDLFVEDYTSPVRGSPDLAMAPDRSLAKVHRSIRTKAKSLLRGLLALGGLALAALFLSSRRRKRSRISLALDKLGLVHA